MLNTERIDHLYQDPHEPNRHLILHYGDLTDAMSLTSLIQKIRPDEVYNLGAMSHVKVSFEIPEYTANVNGLGALRILEAIKLLGLEQNIKFCQASTSELFGKVKEVPQNEETGFHPRSPYGIAKLFAYWTTINYREAFNIFAANGIMFNHESPHRGETFVTRKITKAASRMAWGHDEVLYLGNLEAKRDWGHAKDYVRALWMMLQQDQPDDYVIATGVNTTVREFVIKAFNLLGVDLEFSGVGIDETGIVKSTSNPQYRFKEGQTVIKIDPEYFRPAEVDELLGDASKIRKQLNWHPEYTLDDIIKEMLESDLKQTRPADTH